MVFPNLNGKKIVKIEQYGAIEMSNDYQEGDYNEVFYFTVSKGVSVGFEHVSASTSTTIFYGYSTSGKFN